MASTVDIWNLALTDVGGGLVTDPNEQSTSADLCRLHYPVALDFVLESMDWNFAVKRQEIAQSANVDPVFGFDSSFKIPSDCLRVSEVWDKKNSETNSRFTENTLQWQQEGDYVSANTSTQVWCKYIARIDDPSRFSGSFVNVLAKYLAYRLSIPVSSNAQLKNSLMAEYTAMLNEAGVNNGLTGRTKVVRSNVLMNARFR